MNELALFAGAGGGILGGKLLGWRTVCAVEINEYCQRVLMQRQDDGILEPFPIWGDIRTFDGKPWTGKVDVVSGGFPCQDISVAGKGTGISGERSGLWKEMARVIREVRPQYVFVENSPMLTVRGLGTVLGDLAEMGFDAEWGVISAADCGAPHLRERIWIVAYSESLGYGERREAGDILEENERQDGQMFSIISRTGKQSEDLANANQGRLQESESQSIKERPENRTGIRSCPSCKSWWETEPDVGRVANGVASRVDRLKALGNGQVPIVAATAWNILT